jgi:lysophospholipase L1-like esterase
VQVKTTNTLPAGLDDQEIIYARKLSNTEMSLGFPLPGNVVTAGSTGFGTMTVQEFIPELKNEASKTNNIMLATSGSTIQFTLDREPQMLESIQRVVADGSRPVVIYMAGINDLVAGMTPTQMDERIFNLALYWTRLREAGAKVIVCTVTAANPAYFTPYSETNRNLFNTKLRLAAPYYDALADFADTPQLSGPWTEPGALSYYFDDIHPDFRAHIVMSNILSPLVDAFRL